MKYRKLQERITSAKNRPIGDTHMDCTELIGRWENKMKEPVMFKIRIKKYEILKKILNVSYHQPQIAFEDMIKIKENMPIDLYGYYIRGMLQTNTLNLKKETAIKSIEGIPRKYLMSRTEMRQYKKLPSVLTIYRGTSELEAEPRFSWSMDINVANKFANGFLYSATIEKEQIIALFSENTYESEVIVNLNATQVKRIR